MALGDDVSREVLRIEVISGLCLKYFLQKFPNFCLAVTGCCLTPLNTQLLFELQAMLVSEFVLHFKVPFSVRSCFALNDDLLREFEAINFINLLSVFLSLLLTL